jgi:hypothetical protein
MSTKVFSIFIETPDDSHPLQSNANMKRGDSDNIGFALKFKCALLNRKTAGFLAVDEYLILNRNIQG